MNTQKAIEFLQRELIEGTIDPRIRNGLIEIQDLLETKEELENNLDRLAKGLEKENEELKETIQDLRLEGDEYQENLDDIDLWAMEIEGLIRKVRGKI